MAVAVMATVWVTSAAADVDSPLTGSVIGTALSVDYATGQATTTLNTAAMAHDGNLDTYFASYERSYTWTGLDLGEPHVITRVGWSPRNDGLGPGRMVLGMFEGANRPDFLDAIPLYMIEQRGVIGEMSYGDVDCSRGVRYVRYVGPSDARCNVAEVAFYGTPGPGDDSRLHQLTGLPTVIINTVDAVEPFDKETNIVSDVIIISDNGSKILEADATTRQRGNASRTFPKKPYRIKFEKKQKVLDAPSKAKKWTLINNYGDKTLMRNIVAFEAARRAGMEYVPWCQPVDLILNGEYKGCYQLCDQIEVREGRVDIDEMTPDDIAGEALTGGYLIEVDAYANEEISWFTSRNGIPVTIKAPADDEIVPAQTAYITGAFNELDKRVFGNKYAGEGGYLIEVDAYANEEISWFTSRNGIPVTIKAPADDEIVPAQTAYITGAFNELDKRVFGNKYAGEGSYREILDVPSFLRHFIVGELSGNTDTYWSTYMFKRRNDPKFYVGPVWDFDIAFENDNRTYPINNHSDYIYVYGSSANNMNTFVTRVVKRDPATAGEIKQLWARLRDTAGYDGESFGEYIDNQADAMSRSLDLNFTRWPILNQWVHQNPKVYNSWQAAVNDLKSYVTARIDWLDRKIGYVPGSGVEAIDAPGGEMFVARVDGGVVTVSGADLTATVYDLAGRTVGKAAADAPFTLPAHGVYIVVADGCGQVVKVAY